MKIALFVPCIVDQFYPHVAVSVVRILRRLGHEVVFPVEQTCCGQPAFNSGYHAEARRVAKRLVKVFSGADSIVSVSGSCTTMVTCFYPKWLMDPALAGDVRHIASHMYEFSDFLVNQLQTVDVGARFPHKVTYHDACHGLRELRIKSEPRQLLAAVRELELVEMDNAEECCGFGGTFAVKFTEISTAMGNDKITGVCATGADYLTAGDSSCLMHLNGLLKRQNIPIQTIHYAEILANQ